MSGDRLSGVSIWTKAALCLAVGAAVGAAVGLCSCSSSSSGSGSSSGAESGGTSGTGASSHGGSGTSNSGGSSIIVGAGAGPSSGAGGSSATCSAEFAKADLAPLFLAFAFDVSGSMGKLDEPYYDPELKWKPVVSATKAFFADPSSTNIRAALTFFPADDDKCKSDTYGEPDVPITTLPSPAFAQAIDAITPESADDWRGGTPTLAVLRGTYEWVERLRINDDNGKYAVVLVSDGYPQGCTDSDDEIETVAAEVDSVASRIPTYVIGVSNPPGGPDTVSNLNRLAVAGGTDKAFLIETGDPEKTVAQFKSGIETIRGQALSCEAAIPPRPAGEPFDPEKVNVVYGSSAATNRLGYDADCGEPNAWRFNDAAAPTHIVLCDSTCAAVRSDPAATLRVEFGCERVDAVPR